MKFNQLASALIACALFAPAAMAKSSIGVRVKAGAIHASKSKKVKGTTMARKVRKPRKSKKPINQSGPASEL